MVRSFLASLLAFLPIGRTAEPVAPETPHDLCKSTIVRADGTPDCADEP